jgi:hypothetical protein
MAFFLSSLPKQPLIEICQNDGLVMNFLIKVNNNSR